MAKKSKVSSKVAEPCCDYSPSMYIDFDQLKEIKGVTVGQKIRVMIEGTVKGVEQRESYDDPKKIRGSISVKDFTAEIAEDDENVFTKMANEED